ncbi:Homeobox-leucine zipper protein like [Melia azedarach]|uniref:Homeobox-leucine zipper protein like n=1 Tax=Melia azedarach TaxID=155640 RepID=A0ACC1XJV8_MELAZ|nr:Homeobox-leucine zipper protein like [Melia azedarach]
MNMEAIASIRMSNNKKRFSDEQIKSLEFMFEAESRPESRMKQRLADELGLQPRQVAIWFQNKRARSKTKQIEHEYNNLKAEFEKLASNYELLKRENQSLLLQLQKLKNILGEKS